MSVKSHLTSGASVRPENAVTYPAGCTEVRGQLLSTGGQDTASPSDQSPKMDL